jgi:hypothetical protein
VKGNNFVSMDGKEGGLFFLCVIGEMRFELLKQLFVLFDEKGRGLFM